MFTDLLVPVSRPVFDIASLLRTEGNAALDLHNDCSCDSGCPDCNVLLAFAVSTWATATAYESMSPCDLGVHVNCDDYDPDPGLVAPGTPTPDTPVSWADFDPDGLLANPDGCVSCGRLDTHYDCDDLEPTPLPNLRASEPGVQGQGAPEPEWMQAERIRFRTYLLDQEEQARQ